jgi:hypothetical protein
MPFVTFCKGFLPNLFKYILKIHDVRLSVDGYSRALENILSVKNLLSKPILKISCANPRNLRLKKSRRWKYKTPGYGGSGVNCVSPSEGEILKPDNRALRGS